MTQSSSLAEKGVAKKRPAGQSMHPLGTHESQDPIRASTPRARSAVVQIPYYGVG